MADDPRFQTANNAYRDTQQRAGLHDLYRDAARRAYAAALRTFVCQGCGKAHMILHGVSVRCECGVTSAAEVLPP